MFGVNKTSKDGDPCVTKALDALEIKYDIDHDSDFRFGFELENGRSQLCFIRSDTYEYAGIEIHGTIRRPHLRHSLGAKRPGQNGS